MREFGIVVAFLILIYVIMFIVIAVKFLVIEDETQTKLSICLVSLIFLLALSAALHYLGSGINIFE